MLLIDCPWCGPREETEFTYGGEAHVVRPPEPMQVSDEEWGEYLFFRKNPRGSHLEQWCHSSGCRRWFNMQRDTLSHGGGRVYRMGETAPGSKT